MKKISYLLLLIALFLFGYGVTFAKTYTLASSSDDSCTECIHDYDYIVGTHVFTDAYIQENDFSTQMLMFAASTLDGSSLDNIKMYMYFGYYQMYDVISFGTENLADDTSYEITHVNGVCIDPSCLGETVDVTLKFNDGGITSDLTKTLNYKEIFDEPVKPTKLGHSFVCWSLENSDDCYDFSKPVEDDLVLEANWEVLKYKVTFTDTVSNKTKVVECDFTAERRCTFQKFTDLFILKEGYTFNGWSLAETGEKVYSASSNFDNLFGEDTEFTLYSIFNSSDYTISYNLNGGSFTSMQAPTTVYDPSDLTYDISTPSRVGYTFKKWEVTEGDATVSGGVININSVSNIEIEAVWEPIKYNLKYNNITLNTSVCEYDKTCSLQLDRIIPAPGQYVKNMTVSISGVTYDIGSTVKNLTTASGDLKVNVTFDYVKHVVSYDYAGGTGNDANPTTITKQSAIDVAKPIRNGYTFAGWDVTTGATVASSGNGHKVTLNDPKDIKLTAKWTAHTYKLIYNNKIYGNCTYDVGCTLNDMATADYPAGKVFKNWSYDGKDLGGVVYNLTTANNLNLTLIPIFDNITYGIKYDYDGGVVTNTNPVTYTTSVPTITLNVPTKAGYEHTGWEIIPSTVSAKIANNVLSLNGTTSDLIIKALYSPKEFNITYNLNGGNGAIIDTQCTYVNCILTDVTPSRAGYVFDGWLNSATGYIYQPNANITIDTDSNVELIAKWSNADKYKINYVLNGGTFEATANTSFLANETALLTEPDRVGYTFAGWYLNDSGNAITTVPVGTNNDITVHARWSKNKYNVSYIVADYLGENNIVSYEYDEAYSLEDYRNDFENHGYKLLGWSLTNDGSLYFGNALMFINLLGGLGDVSLYPVVEHIEDDYLINYYLDGGSFVDEDAVDRSYNNNELLTLPEVTKPGYVVSNWKLEDGTEVIPGETKPNRDIVLIPVWANAPITVNLYATTEDGTSYTTRDICKMNQECTVDSLSIPGLVHERWRFEHPDPEGGYIYIEPLESFVPRIDMFENPENLVINLYAEFSSLSYDISYYLEDGLEFDFAEAGLNLPTTFDYSDHFVVLPGLGSYVGETIINSWDVLPSGKLILSGNDYILATKYYDVEIKANSIDPSTSTNVYLSLYNVDNELIGRIELGNYSTLIDETIYENGMVPTLNGTYFTEYDWYLNGFKVNFDDLIVYDSISLYLDPSQEVSFTSENLDY